MTLSADAACVIVAIIIVSQTPEHKAPLTAPPRGASMAPTGVKLYTTLSLHKLFLVFSVYIRVFNTHVGLINELFVSLECSDNDSWL